MESTAFNMDEFYHAAFSTLYSITIHGIHCIQSGCFGPWCIKSTAFNRDALGIAAWTPLHTIGIHCAMIFPTGATKFCLVQDGKVPPGSHPLSLSPSPWSSPLRSLTARSIERW